MLSHGSADLILEACTDFWDGTDIYPLSGSDRCSNPFCLQARPLLLPEALFSVGRFSCFVSSLSSSVIERRFWISTSVPVCQVTAQHLPINPCKYPCPASWMGSVLSWLLVPACSPVWSCPPPLPSNTTHAGTAGALMVRVENLEICPLLHYL